MLVSPKSDEKLLVSAWSSGQDSKQSDEAKPEKGSAPCEPLGFLPARIFIASWNVFRLSLPEKLSLYRVSLRAHVMDGRLSSRDAHVPPIYIHFCERFAAGPLRREICSQDCIAVQYACACLDRCVISRAEEREVVSLDNWPENSGAPDLNIA